MKESEFCKLVRITFPLLISLCSASLVVVINRLFLARVSIDALNGYVSGFVLAVLFQTTCMRISTLGQAYIGYYEGTRELHLIGESVWQMIWFSFLSMFISVPLGYLAMPFVFGTS